MKWSFRAGSRRHDDPSKVGPQFPRTLWAVTDPEAARRATVTEKWHGSASVPTRIGYIDLHGLSVLALAGDHLAIRGRGEMMTDTRSCKIYPARRALANRGIEVRLFSHSSFYFWTCDSEKLLAALKTAGFDVASEEVRFRDRRVIR